MSDSDPDLTPDGVQVSPSLLTRRVSVVLCNHSRFTCWPIPRHFGSSETSYRYQSIRIRCTVNPDTCQSCGNKSPAHKEEWRQKLCEIFQEDPDLQDKTQRHLLELMKEHHEYFCLEENERGETDFEINMGDAPPQKQQPRRMPFSVQEEVSRQLHKTQETGVIHPRSPIACDLALLCLSGSVTDHTAFVLITELELNSVTKPDTFPLLYIENLLNQLGSAQYFSTLDLAAGYWQIGMYPVSHKKAAFVTNEGLHDFCVMPFGSMTHPAAFQWLMQQVLIGLNPENGDLFVSAYKDSFLIFSKSLEEHLHAPSVTVFHGGEPKIETNKCQFLGRDRSGIPSGI